MGCRGFLVAGRKRTAFLLHGKYFVSEKQIFRQRTIGGVWQFLPSPPIASLSPSPPNLTMLQSSCKRGSPSRVEVGIRLFNRIKCFSSEADVEAFCSSRPALMWAILLPSVSWSRILEDVTWSQMSCNSMPRRFIPNHKLGSSLPPLSAQQRGQVWSQLTLSAAAEYPGCRWYLCVCMWNMQ